MKKIYRQNNKKKIFMKLNLQIYFSFLYRKLKFIKKNIKKFIDWIKLLIK